MKKRVFAALGSLIVMNFVCLSFLTFAWFTANQKVDNGMNNITAISDDPIDVSFELYEYDEDNLTGRIAVDSTTTDESENEITLSRFALPQYDTFITERNTYNNKIMRIEVTSKGEVDSSTKFALDIECTGSFTENVSGEEKVTRNMSNIIAFKYFLRHELSDSSLLNETTAGNIYDSSYSIFSGITTSYSYVSVEDNVGTKVSNNKISLPALDIDENDENHVTVLYLEYFYDENLVDYYFENSNDQKPTADNLESTTINFACDIKNFTFQGDLN